MTRLIDKVPRWATPLLLAAFFTLECFIEIKPFGTLTELLVVFAAAAGAGLLVYLAALAMFREKDRAMLWTNLVLLTFLFFSYIVTSLTALPGMQGVSRRYFLAALVGSWALAVVVLKWRRLRLRRFTQFSTTVLILLVAYAGVRCFMRVPAPLPWGKAPPPLHVTADSPDIFYILLDGHTSPESLQEHWGYDASWFVNSLEGAGFHVVSNATANFGSTFFCLTATLNMELPPPIPRKWSPVASIAYTTESIEDAHAKRALRDAGYEVVELSIFPGLDGRRPYYPFTGMVPTTLPGLAFMKTPAGHIADHVWLRQQGPNSLRVIKEVERLAAVRSKVPRFIYAHVMLPHKPYFFDREGNPVLKGIGSHFSEASKEDYLDQLIYVDKLITNTVARIQAQAQRPPVIIIQGDHGFRDLPGSARLPEAFTTLNAMCLPAGRASVQPYPGITPVNTFRLLFNRYFGSNLAFVPDINDAPIPAEH